MKYVYIAQISIPIHGNKVWSGGLQQAADIKKSNRKSYLAEIYFLISRE